MSNQWFSAYRTTGPWLTAIVRFWDFCRRSQFLAILATTLLVGLAGCGQDNPGPPKVDQVKVSAVKGQISVAGVAKPGGAKLTFHPADGSKASFPLPRAQAADDGSFVVGTYSLADGVPPGEYKVTVVLHQVVQVDGENKAGPNLVSKDYSAVQTTPLKATVTEGENQLPKWDLTAATK